MTIKGTITKLNARVDASGNVIEVVTIEGQGLVNQLRPLMQEPLIVKLEPMQLTVGEKA